MSTYRKAYRARKRVEAEQPPAVPALKKVQVDWSGLTAVVVCTECERSFGTWLNYEEGTAFADTHRRWHAYTRVGDRP